MLKVSKVIFDGFGLSFPKLFQIENQLNIKEVMSKNVCVCSFDTFDIHSIAVLSYFEQLLTPSTYIACKV